VDDRASLLSQLQIDRESKADTSDRRWLWWLVLLAVLVGSGVGAWAWYRPSDALLVSVATAEPVAGEVAMARGSILDASGYVIPRRQATVSSKITGKVVEVLIEEGQRVEEGEVVARLDDTNYRASVAQANAQLAQARANLNAAQVAFDNAVPTFERNRELREQAIISEQDFDTMKANYDASRASLEVAKRAVDVAEATLAIAKRNLDDTIVRAPFAGIVTVKAAQEGEMVSPVSAGGGFTRTGIGTIVDMDSLEVEVDVSESFINRVRPGQDVSVRLNAYPDWEIPAHVIAIIPTADRAKATVRVRVGLEERDERILPQMGVRVSFLSDDEDAPAARRGAEAVLIPSDAIESDGATGVVYIVRDDTVERRAVALGARTDSGQVVLSGVTAGARLVVGNLSELTDGARVRIRTSAPGQ
jgi:RND family efflux transporter MFP subunit